MNAKADVWGREVGLLSKERTRDREDRNVAVNDYGYVVIEVCLLYTSPSPRD